MSRYSVPRVIYLRWGYLSLRRPSDVTMQLQFTMIFTKKRQL